MTEKTADLGKMEQGINDLILEVANTGASLQKIRVCEHFKLAFLEFKSVYEKLTKGENQNGRKKRQERATAQIPETITRAA